MPRMLFISLLVLAATGCATRATVATGGDVVFVVAGVGGTSGYGGIVNALTREGRTVRPVAWGAPPPLFMFNFSNQSIHDHAEKKLARRIIAWRQAHPSGRIDVVGHSAGAGVVLGALGRLEQEQIREVILLAPSVSPTYDLRPALARIEGTLHIFCSDRDTVFLKWRTSHFGTYDRIKTPAAGYAGFTGAYPPDKLVQHPYVPAWRELDNDGGHLGSLAQPFAVRFIAPLLK